MASDNKTIELMTGSKKLGNADTPAVAALLKAERRRLGITDEWEPEHVGQQVPTDSKNIEVRE